MRLTYIGALAGFLISILWITLGLGWTLLILLFTILGGGIGFYLSLKGLDSPRKVAIAILSKITE